MTCVDPYKDCIAERSARIDAALADPANAGKANRVLADELGVGEAAIRRHKAMNASADANDAEPQGYEPKPAQQTERVLAAWAIWKEMDGDEQTTLIGMIVNFKNGRSKL